jgi:hypothetical protein
LIVATQSGAVYLLLNVGSRGEPAFALPTQLLPAVPGGEYTPVQFLRAGERVARGARASVDLADWNGDGKLDLILGDWSHSLQLRSNLSATEEQGLRRVLAKLVALDRRAGLEGEEPLRDRLRTAIYYENQALAAELAAIEAELTVFLEPVGTRRTTRLSDFERNHGYVRAICGARPIAAAAAAMLCAGVAYAQNVAVTVSPGSAPTVRAGQVGEVRLTLTMNAPWYVYAPTGTNARQGLIETQVSVAPNERIQFAAPRYPRSQRYGAFDVWRGRGNVIGLSFRVRPRTPAGQYRVSGYVNYQTCNGPTCLPPDRIRFSFPIRVSGG